MQKILVPTDFSSHSDQAKKYARKIAEQSGGEILLLNIMLTPDNSKIHCDPDTVNLQASAQNQYLVEIVQGLRKSMENALEELKYDKSSYLISSGNVSQTIIEEAEKFGADLIIMGTQGQNAHQEFMVGSNAEKVVRISSCPVLTVRNTPVNIKFEKMILACDLNDKIPQPMQVIKEYQRVFDSEIELLHVNTPGKFTSTSELNIKATSFAEQHELNNYNFNIFCDYVEDDGINHFAESNQADLIIVISHKRRGFNRLLAGSVSEGVVSAAHIPVLTLLKG